MDRLIAPAWIVLLAFAGLLSSLPTSADTPPPGSFGETKMSWHGFPRYDFLMDEATNAIEPYQSPADEGNSVRAQVPGKLRCVVVAPKTASAGNPWSWRGYYFDHQPQTEVELLKRGFHIGVIWCDAGK